MRERGREREKGRYVAIRRKSLCVCVRERDRGREEMRERAEKDEN